MNESKSARKAISLRYLKNILRDSLKFDESRHALPRMISGLNSNAKIEEIKKILVHILTEDGLFIAMKPNNSDWEELRALEQSLWRAETRFTCP